MTYKLGLSMLILNVLALGLAPQPRAEAHDSNQAKHYQGIDDLGERCTVSMITGEPLEVADLRLESSFVIESRIPTPVSGTPGQSRLSTVFDSKLFSHQQALKTSTNVLMHSTIRGESPAVLWSDKSSDLIKFELTIEGELNAPRAVRFEQAKRLAMRGSGVIQQPLHWVITAICRNLEANE